MRRRTRNRRRGVVTLASLLVIAPISGCDDRPEPGAAEAYDVVIAICKERLQSTQDYCEPIGSSNADSVWANVLFGRVPGHSVTIAVRTVEGGDARVVMPSDRVPENRSWLKGVEIPRSDACSGVSCKVAVSAVVNGDEVAREYFTFVEQ